MGSRASSYRKTYSNLRTELTAKQFLLEADARFQDVPLAVKKRILAHMGYQHPFPVRSFDLVRTRTPVGSLDLETVDAHLGDIDLVEIKATKNEKRTVRDASLRGFFFGATESHYVMARHLDDRYRFAFVVLSDANERGRPFYVLLTLAEVEAKIRTKRTQYPINF